MSRSTEFSDTFSNVRLETARACRKLTKSELASVSGISVRSLSLFAKGNQPSPETAKALADALDFPVQYFYQKADHGAHRSVASFRSQSRLSAADRDAAIAAGSLAIEVSKWIQSKFCLPPVRIPDLSCCTPEEAATSVRAFLGIGCQVISNMVHMLESMGIRVFSLKQCREVDAFSLWCDGVPYVFLNAGKSAERSRMDAAHELGHLVMHRGSMHEPRQAEAEANTFASCLLMPGEPLLAEMPGIVTMSWLMKTKKRWKVSVAAMNYRMHSLGLLSDWSYRTNCIEIAKRGYRLQEPEPIPHEFSSLLRSVLDLLREDGIGRAQIAEMLSIPESDLSDLLFGLTMSAIDGGGKKSRGGAQLSLVK